jgi:phage FluMu protein Com
MTDSWDERKKALEEEYFRRQDREAVDRMKRAACLGRCPKCGELLQAATFHDVPLDQCPGCRGIWLGLKDLEALAVKGHRSWIERFLKKS